MLQNNQIKCALLQRKRFRLIDLVVYIEIPSPVTVIPHRNWRPHMFYITTVYSANLGPDRKRNENAYQTRAQEGKKENT